MLFFGGLDLEGSSKKLSLPPESGGCPPIYLHSTPSVQITALVTIDDNYHLDTYLPGV